LATGRLWSCDITGERMSTERCSDHSAVSSARNIAAAAAAACWGCGQADACRQ